MKRFLTLTEEFFQELRVLDHDHCLCVKAEGCKRCGAKLDTSNYLRKPRGGSELEDLRFSLCCRREGCRGRVLPKSLRFYGRKVYSSIVVILAIDFMKELGLKGEPARQTIARWKAMWRERLHESSSFMKMARGFLPVGTPTSVSPGGLLPVFSFPEKNSWIFILKFFVP